MAEVGRALLVSHLAAGPLKAAHYGEQMMSISAWASAAAFNNVPVKRDGEVVGVIENINGDLQDAPIPRRVGTAGEQMRRLHAGMLIEGATPLQGLVGVLLESPHYRLLLDGDRVDSIVTPSDLVKLPMRVLVFGAVAHLENAMLDAIERLWSDEASAVGELEGGAQSQILELHGRLHDVHLDPSLLEATSLRQKATVLTARGVFGDDTAAVDATFDDLVEALRNPVMHAARYVDDSLDALRALNRRLKAVGELTRAASTASP